MNITVLDYHVHLYYDENSIEFAKDLAHRCKEKFPIEIWHFHEKFVGPHPMWSVQLSVQTADFGRVFEWITLNHKHLIVFTHPNTGDDLLDHTDHAIWLGKSLDLNIDIFKKA
ncbi:DOPA 4,5-dioxygenase family protein [Bacteriovorax sp. Seq25_V]|uniref:DOPA 4,5-dioxygenase family protein n=1 Tax=Bacteriovorax sp. Seq25_V TaxID=1201288 RepID=UPI000389F1DA|nr:DOPA 4,5-dioxygenase family protein [Bacteriovorax sp. Seq25_V]EQC43697.1 dopa 4,5-dioxygenase family [Bacteriovorax sp. Seq25_V]